MELPAQINPARAQLAAKLREFEAASSALADFRSKVEQASLAEVRALEDSSLTEAEISERVGTSLLQKSIFRVRQAQSEKTVTTLSSELFKALNAAESELQA